MLASLQTPGHSCRRRLEIYGGHEYTAANARFALSVDPDNPEDPSESAQRSGTDHADNPGRRTGGQSVFFVAPNRGSRHQWAWRVLIAHSPSLPPCAGERISFKLTSDTNIDTPPSKARMTALSRAPIFRAYILQRLLVDAGHLATQQRYRRLAGLPDAHSQGRIDLGLVGLMQFLPNGLAVTRGRTYRADQAMAPALRILDAKRRFVQLLCSSAGFITLTLIGDNTNVNLIYLTFAGLLGTSPGDFWSGC